ncbi:MULTISPECIES: M14 family metallopeptidase [Bacillus]|uniref:M14 family metallopeptidase n=1 Tax=Bacillus TaxID=1386 RepID=UPI0002E23D01|nr:MULTISPECIES: M14 family metallocarboxypeptidase [Bacillus]
MFKVYHYDLLERDIQYLIDKFPFIQMNIIGKSVLDRNIYELRIGSGDLVIHYNASFHANEWITSLVLMKWLKSYLHTSHLALKWLNRITLSIVPMVNPDGIELVYRGKEAAKGLFDVEAMNNYKPDYLGWKANIRGIDLNKQYPAEWEKYKQLTYCEKPYYRDFPGYRPLTEPEAIAMSNLVLTDNIDRVVCLHTQGEEFYWGYQGLESEFSEEIAKKIEQISCYKGIRNVKSHAGFRDWFILTTSRIGFTLELGKGINPLPLSQFKRVYQDVIPILDELMLFINNHK